MKYLIAIGICLIAGSMLAQAADVKYVTDIRQITMRTGQGLDYKILDWVKSGEEVEILQQGNQWTMVRRADGKNGWVLSRFLTSKKPNRMILESLKRKNKVIVAQNESLLREHSELKEKSKELEVGFADKQKEFQKTIDAYETLKRESAEFLKLKSSYTKSKKNQNDMVKKMGEKEEELNYLRTQHIFKWFLTGAGVLLLGFIIGFSARRSRSRPSLL